MPAGYVIAILLCTGTNCDLVRPETAISSPSYEACSDAAAKNAAKLGEIAARSCEAGREGEIICLHEQFSIVELDEEHDALAVTTIHQLPSATSPALGTLKRGQKVHVTGTVSGTNWLRVAMPDGVSGYVYGERWRKLAVADTSAQGADAGVRETAPGASGKAALNPAPACDGACAPQPAPPAVPQEQRHVTAPPGGRLIRGARRAVGLGRIAADAEAIRIQGFPPRSEAFRRTPGDSMTCSAASPNGPKTAGTRTTRARRPMDPRGRPHAAENTFCAADHGRTRPPTSRSPAEISMTLPSVTSPTGCASRSLCLNGSTLSDDTHSIGA